MHSVLGVRLGLLLHESHPVPAQPAFLPQGDPEVSGLQGERFLALGGVLSWGSGYALRDILEATLASDLVPWIRLQIQRCP